MNTHLCNAICCEQQGQTGRPEQERGIGRRPWQLPTRGLGLSLMLILFGFCGTVSVQAASHQQAQPAAVPPSGAASSTSPAASQNSSGFLQRRPRYEVEPGDVLSLEFPFTPEMNQTVTVQPDGYISLQGIGGFYARGKTTPELAADLEKSYAKILNNPVITVDLKNFQQPYFVVGGQVGHPGKYDLRAPTTVIEALAIAGGLTPSSKNSQVLLFRRVDPNQYEVKKLNVKKMLRAKNLDEDVTLRPGDMLYVPQSTISKIARFLPTSSLGMYFSPKWIP